MRAANFILMLSLVAAGVWNGRAAAQDFELSQPSRFTTPEAARPAPQASPVETAATASDTERDSIPLARPGERVKRELGQPHSPGNRSTVTTILASLGLVIGIFLVFAWFLRRTMPRSMFRLPSEAVETLGRSPLAGKQNIHLMRVGRKLLLVAVTPVSAETLTEITDPDEVERLTALCKQQAAHGPTAEFREVMRQFEREPAPTGFLGTATASATTGPRGARRGGFDA